MKSMLFSRTPKNPNSKLLLIRQVRGHSMMPVLPPGTVVVAIRSRKLRVGDVVIFYHEGKEKIKRIQDIKESEAYMISDHPQAGTDSRDYGWIPLSLIIGKVIKPRDLRPIPDHAK